MTIEYYRKLLLFKFINEKYRLLKTDLFIYFNVSVITIITIKI